jgi:uncharacterized protein YkwD
MKFRKAAILAIILTFIVTGSALAYTWYNATVNPSAENTLARLINEEHQRVCGRELKIDARLTWVARYKVMDMSYHNYFGHVDMSGKKANRYLGNVGIKYSSWSEILAWNGYPIDNTAKAIYIQFMGSTPHRQAIQSCTYTRYGVGSFRDGARKYFAVEFIRP